jgi:hypothetical protein
MSKISPFDIIVEEGLNPRDFSTPESIEHIATLKAQIIADKGVQQPLWVRFDATRKKAVLIDGECRLRAVLELIAEGHDIVGIPVIQKSGKVVETLADRIAMALSANEHLFLSQIEVGGTYLKLQGFGWSVAKIAARVGKKERFVEEAITLADSPDPVQALLNSGGVSKGLVLQVVKASAGDGEKAVAVLEDAAAQAKAEGRATAKRAKIRKKPAGDGKLVPAVLKMLGEVTLEDLNNEDNEYISISREALLKLSALLGNIIPGPQTTFGGKLIGASIN